MAFKRKRSHKKAYIAFLLLVVVIVASVAIVLITQLPSATPGVRAGDTFTYSIVGTSSLNSIDAVDTPGFSEFNQTDYYEITITNVTGSLVSFDTLWQFKNGTGITSKQIIDLSNGNKTDNKGFWAIYASNLKVGALLRPTGHDGLVVNQTSTRTYANSSRETNFVTIGAESYLTTDPTHSTLRYDTTVIFFDKQSGMLENLTWITDYSNPEMREVIVWNLVSSSVWNV